MTQSFAGLDTLLELDGSVFEQDEGFWIKIETKKVEASPHVPHATKEQDFEADDAAGLPAGQAEKIGDILAAIDTAELPADIALAFDLARQREREKTVRVKRYEPA